MFLFLTIFVKNNFYKYNNINTQLHILIMSICIFGKTYLIDKTFKLDLANNNLTVIPEDISKLTKLQFLNLNNNNFTVIPESICNLSQLQILNLENNNLTVIPESIGNLSQLRSLFLGFNNLLTLPKSIINLTNLKTIWLYNNKLTILPACCKKIKEKLFLLSNSYQLNNLDHECDFLIIESLNEPLQNLPVHLKEIWLLAPKISLDKIKIPFECKIFINDIYK